MEYLEKLEYLLEQKDGLLLTSDVVEAGISKQLLGTYVKKGIIERVSHGVYLSKEAFEDEMYVLQARSQRAVFSHETALYIHDLTDRDPLSYSLTLPSGYNASKFKEDGTTVYFVKEDKLDLGVENGKTIFGRSIRIYDKERTICDLIRSRNRMDVAILNEGIKRYLAVKDKDLSKLMKYAKELRVDKTMRHYLEVLL